MKKLLLSTALTLLCLASAAHATPILSVSGPGAGGTPARGTSHGWTFTANQNFWVTDLGLYDGNGDGFDISHDIGLYRKSDGSLLTFGTLSAGQGDILINGFRYIDTVDVILSAGEQYIISFFSVDYNNDLLSVTAQNLVVDSLITINNGNWGWTDSLGIPAYTTSSDRIGPNFLYSTSAASVPEPSTLVLLIIGLLGLRARVKNT